MSEKCQMPCPLIWFLTRFSEGKILVIRLGYVGGRAGVNNFFCAQLLLHFSTDFNQTFTEVWSWSAPAHIVGVLWFGHFWQNYGPFFHICNSSVRNSFYTSQGISTKLSQNYCHQVPWRILSGFCDLIIFDRIMGLCFFPHNVIYIEKYSSVCNSYISQGISTKL